MDVFSELRAVTGSRTLTLSVQVRRFRYNVSLHCKRWEERGTPCTVYFCYLVADWIWKTVKEPTLYRGKDVVDTFLPLVIEDVQVLDRKYNVPNNMTVNDERSFRDATNYLIYLTMYLCKKKLIDKKVRNHCHVRCKHLGVKYLL